MRRDLIKRREGFLGGGGVEGKSGAQGIDSGLRLSSGGFLFWVTEIDFFDPGFNRVHAGT